MKPMLAPFAQEIWDLRLSGKKPSGMVFVTAIGELNCGNFQVLAPSNAIDSYDWRWVMDLSVAIVYSNITESGRVDSLVRSIIRCSPNGGYIRPFSKDNGYLWTWNTETNSGDLWSWWRGTEAFPEIGLPGCPEELTRRPLSNFDKSFFVGLGIA